MVLTRAFLLLLEISLAAINSNRPEPTASFVPEHPSADICGRSILPTLQLANCL
jgi:hypothetical protein